MIKKFDFLQFNHCDVIPKDEENIFQESEDASSQDLIYTQSQFDEHLINIKSQLEQEAYQRGYQACTNTFLIEENEQKQKIESIILQIFNDIKYYDFEDHKNFIMKEYFEDILSLIYQIFKKLTTHELEEKKISIISDTIREILQRFVQSTNFTIALHPSIIEEVQAQINAVAAEHKISHIIKFYPDDNISNNSCHILHLNTRLTFNLDDIFLAIDDIIKQHIA